MHAPGEGAGFWSLRTTGTLPTNEWIENNDSVKYVIVCRSLSSLNYLHTLVMNKR